MTVTVMSCRPPEDDRSGGRIVKDGVRRMVKDRQLAMTDLVDAIREYPKLLEATVALPSGPKIIPSFIKTAAGHWFQGSYLNGIDSQEVGLGSWVAEPGAHGPPSAVVQQLPAPQSRYRWAVPHTVFGSLPPLASAENPQCFGDSLDR